MKFGVHLIGAGPMLEGEWLAQIAQRAEDLGFAYLWVSDHIVLPVQSTAHYPYTADGQIPFAPTTPILEPLTTLAYVAGVTRRIRIGTSVLIVPYRHPLITAKMIATLDVLSGGRFVCGVGVGWLTEEFRALGLSIDERGARTQEYLQIMKECWTQEDPAFHGKFYQFSGIKFAPKPRQKPHPPIWVGGNSPAALRRVIEVGDGWHGIWLTPEEVERKVAMLRKLAAEAGREFGHLTLSVLPVGKVPVDLPHVERYHQAGVDVLLMPRLLYHELDQARDITKIVTQMETFARQVKDPAEKKFASRSA
jgi:probable F420-dependent oxidoreductase